MTGAVKKIVDKFGGISVLIQNAGRSQRARWEHTQIQVDKDLFELNVFSVVQLTRQLSRRTWCKKCGTGTLFVGKTFSRLKGKGRGKKCERERGNNKNINLLKNTLVDETFYRYDFCRIIYIQLC